MRTYKLSYTGEEIDIALGKIINPEVIMDSESNPEVLSICYNRGWCSSPTKMTLTEAINVIDIGDAFVNSQITHFEELKYFKNLTSIASAFTNCQSLTSIIIPNSVIILNNDTFSGCNSLTTLKVDYGNPKYSDINNVIYNKEKTTLILCPPGITEYSIPNYITEIGTKAFRGCSNLISLIIPDNVRSLGNQVFIGCNNLKSIGPIGGNYNIQIGWNITIPENSFENHTNLLSVTIPSGVRKIEANAFSSCSNLTSITIPSSVQEVGNYAFKDCISLPNIIFTNTDYGLEFKDSAFSGCINLTSVETHSTYVTLGERCFYNCKELISVPGPFLNIPNFAFYGCSKIDYLTLNAEIIRIGISAFEGCEALETIDIESDSQLQSIGENAFSNCKNLQTIYMNCETAPTLISSPFGTDISNYTGIDSNNNIIFVPATAIGYESGYWLDPLQAVNKCEFLLSKTL